jgi:hypothetical protein
MGSPPTNALTWPSGSTAPSVAGEGDGSAGDAAELADTDPDDTADGDDAADEGADEDEPADGGAGADGAAEGDSDGGRQADSADCPTVRPGSTSRSDALTINVSATRIAAARAGRDRVAGARGELTTGWGLS